MSSMHRTITGDVLVQHLSSDALQIDQRLLAASGRSGRTLVKEGPLRLTLMGLSAGGVLPPHSTDNPVSIQVLQGDVTFFALDNEYSLAAGDVLIFGAGVEHAARSRSGATILLTVAYVQARGGHDTIVGAKHRSAKPADSLGAMKLGMSGDSHGAVGEP